MSGWFRFRPVWQLWPALCLLIPVIGGAQSAHQGVCVGEFTGPHDEGEFALYVNDTGNAAIIAFDNLDDDGFVSTNVRIGSDGEFRFVTRFGQEVEGRITDNTVSGQYGSSADGRFDGQRLADDGPLSDSVGYYSGPADIRRTGIDSHRDLDGNMAAIVAADGTALFLLEQAYSPYQGGYVGPNIDIDFGLPFGLGFLFGGPFHSLGGLFSNWLFPWFSFDFGFQFNLPTYGVLFPWGFQGPSLEASAGMVHISAAGEFDATLANDLRLRGSRTLDGEGFEGTLVQRMDGEMFDGDWSVERRDLNDYRKALRPAQLVDFDNDGSADLLWRHDESGENAVWLMNDLGMEAERTIDSLPDLGWSLLAQADIDGDGQPDLVWQHQRNGSIQIWASAHENRGMVHPEAGWLVLGAGDFDGDSRAEILVRHAESGLARIVADPEGRASLQPMESTPSGSWTVLSIRDLDGNGIADIVWARTETSEVSIWLMAGGGPQTIIKPFEEPLKGYEISGVGDFNGDGTADLLWFDREADDVAIMLLNDELTADQVFFNTQPHPWQPVGIGDMDGDGTDDLFWRNRVSGENEAWKIVNGRFEVSYSLPEVPDLNWSVR